MKLSEENRKALITLYSEKTLREKADYDCFFKADREDINTFHPQAITLFDRIKELIQQ